MINKIFALSHFSAIQSVMNCYKDALAANPDLLDSAATTIMANQHYFSQFGCDLKWGDKTLLHKPGKY